MSRWLQFLRYVGLARPKSHVSAYSAMAWLAEDNTRKHGALWADPTEFTGIWFRVPSVRGGWHTVDNWGFQ